MIYGSSYEEKGVRMSKYIFMYPYTQAVTLIK